MQLRDYQTEAVESIYAYFFSGKNGHPLVVMPTGSGKSVVIGDFVRGVLATWPHQRIVIATHVRELIAQNFEKLKTLWPGAPAGIYSAGLGRRQLGHPVTFVGIQSVFNRAHELGHIDLVLVDEAHLIPKSGEGMYRKFLDDCTTFNPRLKVIGFTATPFRLKSGMLHKGEGRIFTDICYDTDILRLIDGGYLSPLVPKEMESQIDTGDVSIRNGEFVAAELQAAAERDGLTEKALDEVFHFGGDRKSWLFFCSGVAHAEHVAEALRDRGVGAAVVTGTTPKDERDEIIRAYKTGELQAITNCDVLTTGFDAPQTDLLVMLRPTQSPGLYVQIMGRGMRIADGKRNCLVLDFAGNVMRHGPINEIQIREGGKGNGKAPMKRCPVCLTVVGLAEMECPECGYQWPQKERIKHEPTATTLEIISRPDDQLATDTRDFEVGYMELRRHKKLGKPDSLRIDYYKDRPEEFAYLGLPPITAAHYSEWAAFEHGGYPARKAEAWWRRMVDPANFAKPPKTVTEALARRGELRIPIRIAVRKNGKFWEVLAHEFSHQPALRAEPTDADGRPGATPGAGDHGGIEAA